MPSELNLSIGLVPLITFGLQLIIVMFFMRFLAWKLHDRPIGQALAFLF